MCDLYPHSGMHYLRTCFILTAGLLVTACLKVPQQTGFLASLTSAVFAVVFGGLACIGVVGAVRLSIPALWSYRVDEG